MSIKARETLTLNGKFILMEIQHWSTVLNFLIQNYFSDSITTCILGHGKFDLHSSISSHVPILNIWIPTLATSFRNDVYNFTSKELEFQRNGIIYDDVIMKLTVAIEDTHCESFIVFQEHIPFFARVFYKASIYSVWRSIKNRFIFAYSEDLVSGETTSSSYFNEYLFKDQPNILIVISANISSTIFDIKTNKFVGSRYNTMEDTMNEFYLLNRYDASKDSLLFAESLHTEKLSNMEGREVVVGIFDYRPFMVVDYDKYPRVYDRAADKSQDDVLIDGTDVRVLITFCEFKNCTVQADTSEKSDWGMLYVNYTGEGLFGMTLEREIDYGIGGMYLWLLAYVTLDITTFLGRSGVTCLVPAPTRLISWTLPLRPFQYTLWLCVLSCLSLEAFALFFTLHFDNLTEDSINPSNWTQNLLVSIATILKLFINQSTSYSINSMSVRLILIACYLIDIIVTSIYGGGLASILTLPSLGDAADSRKRLYEHKLTWTGTSEAWTIGIRGVSDDPVSVGLLESFHYYDAEHIRNFSRTENMAFIVERMPFGHIGNSELIDPTALARFKIMVDDIYFAYYVAYVPRAWSLLSVFNDFILIWHSSGFSKYWEWKIAADYMNANTQNRIIASEHPKLNFGPEKLGMDNFIGLVLLWVFGMTLSFLAFLLELGLRGRRTA